MNFEAAIAEVQQIVGWRSDKATEIGNALKFAQTQREKAGSTFPWFLRQTKPVNTVAGTQIYSIPTGYIQDTEEREGNLFIYSNQALGSKSRTIFLRKMAFKDLLEKYFGVWPSSITDSLSLTDQSDTIPPGVPRDYALKDGSVVFGPTPDAAYVVNWRAWFADASLGAGVENNWLIYAPWVLIGEAARKIGSDLENASAVAKANVILERANGDFFKEVIHREEAGVKRSMGSRL